MAGVPKRLTEMQQRFAQLLVTNEGRRTPTECAIEAGYEKDSAYVRASELRNPKKYPLVVQYIGEIREEYIGYNIKKDSFLSVWCNQLDSNKEFKKYVFQIGKKGKNLNININSLENINIDDCGDDDISFHSHIYDKINNENICHIYS